MSVEPAMALFPRYEREILRAEQIFGELWKFKKIIFL